MWNLYYRTLQSTNSADKTASKCPFEREWSPYFRPHRWTVSDEYAQARRAHYIRSKGTGCPVRDKQAQRGGKGIVLWHVVLTILNLCARRGWGVNATLQPLYSLERNAVPFYWRKGGSRGPCGWVRKTSLPLGFELQIVQAVASRYTGSQSERKA
jgi:hypothetical protein